MDMQLTEELSPVKRRRTPVSFPVLMKEMRSRMRGNRAPVLLAVVTGLTILVGLLILHFSMENFDGSTYQAAYTMSQAGKAIFIGLLIAEGVLMALIAPGLTAGAISIEREKQTLELLLLTRLSNVNIVLGKYLSSLSFALMLLVCALPVMAISFLLGGVDPAQLLWSLVLLLSIALLFGAVGLYFSARTQKTATAVVATYAVCLGWLVAVPILAVVCTELSYDAEICAGIIIIHTLLFAMLAAVPVMLFAGLCAGIPRCALSAVSQILLWLCLTTATVAFFFMTGLFESFEGNPDLYMFFVTGNPAWAIAAMIFHDEMMSGMPSIPYLPWVLEHLMPITVGLQALGALAFLSLTVNRMRMHRR